MKLQLPALIYSGGSSAAASAEVLLSESEVRVEMAGVTSRYVWSDIKINERLGRLAVKLLLPDGRLIELAHSPELELLLDQQYPQGGVLAKMESRWAVVLGLLVLLPVVLWAAYTWVIPKLAENAAGKIPSATRQSLGQEVLEYLDENLVEPSQLSEQQVQRVERLWARLDIGDGYQLALRYSEKLGANALALPGGTVMLTDDLVLLLQNDDELAAVIGHELGHIDNRHMTTQVLQTAALALLINWVVGDIGGVAELTLTTVPTVLGQLSYSRKLEAEADQYAVIFLQRRNLPRGCIGSGLRKIVNAIDDTTDDEPASRKPSATSRYLRTHPYIEDRIAAVGGELCD